MISKIIYVAAFSSVIALSNINAMENNTNNTNNISKRPTAFIASPGANPTESGEGITPSKRRNDDIINKQTSKRSNIKSVIKLEKNKNYNENTDIRDYIITRGLVNNSNDSSKK